MRRSAALAACCCCTLAALAAMGPARAADEVTEQIDQGRAYYAEGDYAGAITELEFALNAIRARVSSSIPRPCRPRRRAGAPASPRCRAGRCSAAAP